MVRTPDPPYAGPVRRTALIVILAAWLAACSGSASEPLVVSRDVTDVTDPVPETTPEATTPPEPLDYAIEWTPISERVDEGTVTVPLDYTNPQGDTIERNVRIPIQRIAPAGYGELVTFCRRADEAESRDTGFAVR